MSERDFRLVRRAAPATHDPEGARRVLHAQLPPRDLSDLEHSAKDYVLSDELEVALNTALALGAPLLLTGEPGTGKSQAAYYMGWYFGIPVFPFHVKSVSTAADLKYDFDAVAYLRWAQHGEEKEFDRSDFLRKRALWRAYEHETASVVLVDEIDKAPRDFPNDLLHELDQAWFPHPFDEEEEIRPKAPRQPIVLVTSNSERRLPDAFLRRCIHHRIELTPQFVERVVEARTGTLFPELDESVVSAAIDRFEDLRRKPNLSKKPSPAELLAWLAILDARGVGEEDLQRELADLPGLDVLVKDSDDRRRI